MSRPEQPAGAYPAKGDKMLEHNKRMQEFLKGNGIDAVPWYIAKGSMKGCWRLSGRIGKRKQDRPINESYQKWTPELIEKFTALGFKDFDGQPLSKLSGNGGMFSVFVRLSGGFPQTNFTPLGPLMYY